MPNSKEQHMGATMKNEKHIYFSAMDFEGVPLPEQVKSFLIESGLPEFAPPYLEFGTSQTNFFKIKNTRHRSEHYFSIGTTGGRDKAN
ncbi:hypothetical protein [Paenibacillus thiaminolyticus]|uniref:hypothetical protein n=1 Tax=Paenibacillus thiaminolyticus TaxID=49283 RepID=UPI000E6CE4BD|nr:hypothetical protein [Paenibacillus thiaminolyticus]